MSSSDLRDEAILREASIANNSDGEPDFLSSLQDCLLSLNYWRRVTVAEVLVVYKGMSYICCNRGWLYVTYAAKFAREESLDASFLGCLDERNLDDSFR
jgi:hypothetical protein